MALVVFTGGARSGKSSAAQRLAETRASGGVDVVVVVFGRESAADPEFAARVAAHRAGRPGSWRTFEAVDARSWIEQIPADTLLVLDCLGTLMGLCMEEAYAETSRGELAHADAASLPAGFESAVAARFGVGLEWLLRRSESDGAGTIVVTNEVGEGVVPEWASGRFFRDELGRANRMLVDAADAAYLCVAGRLVELHGLDRDARWPED